MLQHCDFEEQPTLYGENGRLRPDAIVHLPGGKRIVVDVKTPLEAFLDAQDIEYESALSSAPLSTAEIAARAHGFTVSLECWQ